jgi:hypothetical protein
MTLSQSFNPHSFVIFMTLAMGISYVFFNTRHTFSIGKIIALLILIVPFFIAGFEQGHMLDITLGAIIGYMTARGSLGLFELVVDGWSGLFNKQQTGQTHEQTQSPEQAQSSNQENDTRAEAEFKRRQQQAEQERREKASGGAGQENKSKNQQNSDQGQQSKSKSQTKTDHQRPAERKKTPLEQAYESLGITQSSSYADAKKMYRRMISRHHEDKMHGMPESEIQESREKAKKINVAWDKICANRGWI